MITTRGGGPIVLAVRPIEPHGGRVRTAVADIVGTAIIGARTHNNFVPDRLVRLFTGDVTGYAKPGAMFGSYIAAGSHEGESCGVWTVFAVVSGGRLIEGEIPGDSPANGRFMTFELG
jgi:hypothetical protein